MLDLNEYGVVALDPRAMTAIGGGDTGCAELAYAIGYVVGWTLHFVYDEYRLADTPILGIPAY